MLVFSFMEIVRKGTGRSVQELAVNSWALINYNRVLKFFFKVKRKYRSIQMRAKCSITQSAPDSHTCPDCHLYPFLGDCERFPPLLIRLLVCNCLAEEVGCF